MTKIYFNDHQVGKIKLKAKGKCNCEVWKDKRHRKKRGRRSESNSFESYWVEEKDFDGKPKKCKLKAY